MDEFDAVWHRIEACAVQGLPHEDWTKVHLQGGRCQRRSNFQAPTTVGANVVPDRTGYPLHISSFFR
jgi:hypothetical protein